MTELEYFGGAHYASFGVGGIVLFKGRTVWVLVPTTTANCQMMDATHMRPGDEVYILNKAGAASLQLNPFGASGSPGSIATLLAGKMAIVVLLNNSTSTGQWYAKIRNIRN